MSDQNTHDVDSSSMRGFTRAVGEEGEAKEEKPTLVRGVDYDTDTSSMRLSERARKILMPEHK